MVGGHGRQSQAICYRTKAAASPIHGQDGARWCADLSRNSRQCRRWRRRQEGRLRHRFLHIRGRRHQQRWEGGWGGACDGGNGGTSAGAARWSGRCGSSHPSRRPTGQHTAARRRQQLPPPATRQRQSTGAMPSHQPIATPAPAPVPVLVLVPLAPPPPSPRGQLNRYSVMLGNVAARSAGTGEGRNDRGSTMSTTSPAPATASNSASRFRVTRS